VQLPAPEDIRGMTVRDRHGLIAGRVADLYVDGGSGAVLYLGVAAGPAVAGLLLVPLDDGVVPTADPLDVELVVPWTGAEVRSAPVCAAGDAPSVATEIAVRRHFAQAGARRGVDGGEGLGELAGVDPARVRTVRWGT
jgi:hypothetical protein